jgi:hypothetical protein
VDYVFGVGESGLGGGHKVAEVGTGGSGVAGVAVLVLYSWDSATVAVYGPNCPSFFTAAAVVVLKVPLLCKPV